MLFAGQGHRGGIDRFEDDRLLLEPPPPRARAAAWPGCLPCGGADWQPVPTGKAEVQAENLDRRRH